MKKRPIRLVAVLLAMLMCLTLLPVTAMAEIAELPARVITALQSSEGLKTLFTANAPVWPKIDTLTKNEGAMLSSTNNHTYDRTITSVEHTEYTELEDGGSSEGMQTWIVGEIVLHVDDVMKSDFQYKLSTNALNITLKDVPEDAETDLENFCGVIFTAATAEKISNAFVGMVIDDCEVYYAYRIKIVVDTTPVQTWPKIDTLTKNEGAMLSSTNNHTYDRIITSVEHTEYTELEDGGSSEGMQTWIVGEIVLHIDDVMKSDFQYKLSTNALNITLKDVPEDAETDLENFCGVIFTAATAEKVSNAFVGMVIDDCEVYYAYKIKIVVDQTSSYPVLQSLTVNNNAVLTGADHTTIPIGTAKFTNYSKPQDGTNADGDKVKIAGEINIYITSALKEQQYTLSAEMLTASFTTVSGYGLEGLIQGIFKSGEATTTSIYYAYLESDETMYCYTLNVVQGLPEDGIYLSADIASRITPTKARVTFTASKAGTYHYAVVDAADTTIPTMPDAGAAMMAGENTFTIDGLTEGAKKVYIWGKDAAGKVSQSLVVDIAAEAISYSLLLGTTPDATDGIFRITADGEDVSFKTQTMVAVFTTAKGIYEGQQVTVWMGNPYTDQDLTAVSLIQSGTKEPVPAAVDSAADSFTFTMPAADVRSAVGDNWRTYTASTTKRYTLTGTSSTFDQTNVSGLAMGSIVFRDAATNNIIKQAKEGTVVTATPVPSTTANYTLKFAFAEWSNANGFTLPEGDTTKDDPLTFTMGAENVTLKANFKFVGTEVTWGTNLAPDAAGAPVVSMPGYMASPCVFKNQSGSAHIDGTAWQERYEFQRWEITRGNGQPLSDSELDTSQTVNPGTPGYWCVPKFEISGEKMTVTAIFRERNWGSVTVNVNNSARGTATASVNGKAADQVFENQTVTLTATPGERYTLSGWEVKDSSGAPIEVTKDAKDANKATFNMPTAGGKVTATAIFAVDPDKASDEKVLKTVALYQSNGTTLVASGNKQKTAFTVTLPAGTDTSKLGEMILKLTVSDYATVAKKGDPGKNWTEGAACGMELDKAATFTVTAENGDKQDYTVTITKAKSTAKDITAVKLLNADKSLIAEGKLSGTTWIITLPSDTDKALINKIGSATDVYMQVLHTGVSVRQEDGWNDADGTPYWNSGDVMCGISVNTSKKFTVTAENGDEQTYTVAIKYTAPNAPTLSNGSATRTSKTGATVKFTSSEAGNYFYKVVGLGAAAPTVDTGKNGTSAVQGENTITLSNLTEDARDIYIVVVGAAGGESATLKVEIPAYGSGSETPDTGKFTITATPPKGGTITTNRTRADQGDEIIVTVTPDSGYQMVEGSLTYTLAVDGGQTVKITGSKFTMPASNVTITCKWETATTTAKGITSFSINGVAGAVNNSTNTITITMPRGTDVTKLTPVIATNGVKSLTPGNGETVDFTNAVTYTAAMEDGSSKTYTVTVYVDKGTLADQFWDKLTDFATQVPWWQYAEKQQSTSKYPKYW